MQFSGDGLLARCLQHETDHTRGTVFGDRLSTRWRKKLQKAHEKAADALPRTTGPEGSSAHCSTGELSAVDPRSSAAAEAVT